jgi:hypothetical protein
MREIKFRGKRKDTGEWVYGYFTRNDESGRCYITTQSKTGGAYPWEVDPATVGQYTGLKDKNGREIYEGDIIFRPNEVGRIEFSEDGSFLIRFPHHLARLNATWEPIEVIGNIHDNPELLEAES